jgi:hypothetical protein
MSERISPYDAAIAVAFTSRLDRIEQLIAHQSGMSQSLQAEASMTHKLFQDLCHQVDRISERLELQWSNEPRSAPTTPAEDSTLPQGTSAPISPISRPRSSIGSGGASPKPADVPYGTPSPEGVWYGVKTGLNGCKLVTNSWSVCESVVKDKQTKKPFRGADWHKFTTAAEAYAYIEAC